MLIIKKNNLARIIKKNYIGYFFIFLFCAAATASVSCCCLSKKAANLSSGIPFNYPGLRIEMRGIKAADLVDYSPLIVCFGDSVTFGWNLKYSLSYPSQLEALIKQKHHKARVLNCGIGGEKVKDGLKRVERDILGYNPDIVILNFGLNDGMLHKSSETSPPEDGLYYLKDGTLYLPAVGIDEFEEKYSKLLETLLKNDLKIIVLGLTPVTEEFNPENSPELAEKQKEIYSVYNKRVKGLAYRMEVEYADLWDTFTSRREGLEKLMQQDGIHPDYEGLKLIADVLLEKIEDF